MSDTKIATSVPATAVDLVYGEDKKHAIETTSSSEDEPSSPAPASGRTPGKFDVLIQGVALFSDGYNIQIIGYMNTVLAKL